MNPVLRQRLLPPGHAIAGVHPVLDRVLRARGVASADDLALGLDNLLPPGTLTGLDAAAEVLATAVMQGRRIVLVGDFDADGATSVALGILALRWMGAVEPGYLVPNRFEFGYGLTPPIAAIAADQGAQLLVTVDNGISSHAGVAEAHAHGMQVIVTDHHLPGPSLPAADVIVNPNLTDSRFPSKSLAGVGVIFYVMAALRQALRGAGWFERRGLAVPSLAELLDLVALGTIADVVALDRNNRILVEQGLRRIRAGRCRPGLLALLGVGGRDAERAVASDLAFAAGPRLNAAGRLEDMTVGIECLLAEDARSAAALAGRLDALNRERRAIEARMQDEALADLEARIDGDALTAALCLYDANWHQGVVGILASRLRERFHRPALVFAPAGDGELKGSGRSIPGLHLRDAIARVDSLQPGLIPRFGGHAGAAGLSLAEADFDTFSSLFTQVVADSVDPAQFRGELLTDGPLQASDLELPLAEEIRAAGPWGQGFPEPVFHNVFRVHSRRIVGERHLRLQLSPVDSPRHSVEAIAFGAVERGWDGLPETIEMAYRLDVNHWQGRKRLQLMVVDMRPLTER
ncbi:single-stranded-DNA-specific exonuclease [Natronocella acetinitrilica]|jgi:single-stranded-DNA-specific exonuclease|uniref:Single-stranded-DNA-specific exonuclease RecJ n=1 Tax=Natronocella acetinitrilica TaxID=414046 RepID=A0AAE3G6Y8_9GAMM|nr:single-stranded-DNA-specific exonuclease RecJ [Natronocella acetinitrilica]MCP1676184.1 single-stranded-DNA-specific exonuclease [Natronocella acetinitrilica]